MVTLNITAVLFLSFLSCFRVFPVRKRHMKQRRDRPLSRQAKCSNTRTTPIHETFTKEDRAHRYLIFTAKRCSPHQLICLQTLFNEEPFWRPCFRFVFSFSRQRFHCQVNVCHEEITLCFNTFANTFLRNLSVSGDIQG